MDPIRIYRIAHRLRFIPILPKILTYFIRLVFSCYLPYTAKIGRNTSLGYGGLGIVIHNDSIIGNDCKIDQNVTIGGKTRVKGVPEIGNNVYIGAGSILLGPITIGDNCVIGANSVVITDIPSKSLVVGIPGKIKKQEINREDY